MKKYILLTYRYYSWYPIRCNNNRWFRVLSKRDASKYNWFMAITMLLYFRLRSKYDFKKEAI